MTEFDPFGATGKDAAGSDPPSDAERLNIPERIGRFRVTQLLGMGSYGVVYLARDDELDRLVAIKVPHDNIVSRAVDASAYLTEARTVANLVHPNIAPVHDVGSTETCGCYIVSMYVEGESLSAALRKQRLTFSETAELIATIASALHYAHTQGLVHRDVKPGNILLGTNGTAYLVDFGLAIKDPSPDIVADYSGTPAYMSPEQARGEGHRVDGRSDVFSLGVVLYQLLVGNKPFRGNSEADLRQQVEVYDPPLPRQLDKTIPKELERICRKAMAKRASERYASAQQMADDLRHFLTHQSSFMTKVQAAIVPAVNNASVPETASLTGSSDSFQPGSQSSSRPVAVVPKGLRSFDSHDVGFFLSLLPGPRDRDGLPDSVRFWKTSIEETDSNQTFAVGLMYGPSGCGKSSLVKAGLLPNLSDDVVSVYVEATADNTPDRLLHALRKSCPELPQRLNLVETVSAIRRGYALPTDRKVLIVLDQFEQWLHAARGSRQTELIHALRQCDGGRVQCLVMVRDDFWLGVSRFFRDLETRIVEGENSALCDLFDVSHAEKVLLAFGRAFGRISEDPSENLKPQKDFVKQAVAGMETDGKVISVRLALFAEMMKSRPWIPASLQQVGGTTGVGLTFLEETFSATTAPPEHRRHQIAARAVLQALLPESGADMKGQRTSRKKLLQVSGYRADTHDFDDLLRLLDSELRLITPVDTETQTSDVTATSAADADQQSYQLTHDYLVHSLREWLTRRQQQSRQGRAELRLAERSALWNAKPEVRQLPDLIEYLTIQMFTDPRRWNTRERKLLRSALRHHLKRMSGLAAVLIVAAIGAWQVFGSIREQRFQTERQIEEQFAANRVLTLVHQLSAADTDSIPFLLAELQPWRMQAEPQLADGFAQAPEGSQQKLHFALAMTPASAECVRYVARMLPSLDGAQLDLVRRALLPQQKLVSQLLWKQIETTTLDGRNLIAAATALALYAPRAPQWKTLAPDVARQLTELEFPEQYLDDLNGVTELLVPPLLNCVRTPKLSVAERGRAAAILCRILTVEQQSAAQLPAILVDWILDTDNPDDFQRLLSQLRPHSYGVEQQMRAIIATTADPESVARQAAAATVLCHYGDTEQVWPLLRASLDPSLRSLLIDRLTRLQVSHQELLQHLVKEPDAAIRQAIVLVLGGLNQNLSPSERQHTGQLLERMYVEDPNAGVHSAVNWTLRQWQMETQLQQLDSQLTTCCLSDFESPRNWTVNSVGQTYIKVNAPNTENTTEPSVIAPATVDGIDYAFAVAACEVTVADFQKFRPDHQHHPDRSRDPNCPVNNVSWYDAVAYCNWLSDQEGLTRCYDANASDSYASGVGIPEDLLERTGYRLPTEAEWDRFCRAGTESTFSFGRSPRLLSHYAMYQKNAQNRTWPVGSRLPGIQGAFDMHGNVWEWSQSLALVNARSDDRVATDPDARLLCGGAFDNPETRVQSDSRLVHFPQEFKYSYGFRPVRTLPASPESGRKE